jgi:hypothetical protein
MVQRSASAVSSVLSGSLFENSLTVIRISPPTLVKWKLERIETSFNHLRKYTSQVAHELRTPLQLMRLQVETNAARMEPGLAEDLQQELARLSN